MAQDLVSFINNQSDSIRVAMEKTSKGKKKVNHRKYIQKRMKSSQKPKPVYTPASTKISLNSKGGRVPSITMRSKSALESGRELPPWITFSSLESEAVVPKSQYQACCDPEVDEVLSAFESVDVPVGSPSSCLSDPFSPYSSTISESGEEYTFDTNFDSPYQGYVEDCGYCSDISQFSPPQKYW